MARRSRRPSRRRRTLAGFPKGSTLELYDQAVEALDEARLALIVRDCATAERMLDKVQRRVNVAKARGMPLTHQAKVLAERRALQRAMCKVQPAPRKRGWLRRIF